jgi:hypothetical protein
MVEAIMQWLMKCCARGAIGLGAAALLLSGIQAHARAVPGPADAQFRESQPRLLAQSKTQPTAAEQAEQLEKCRLEEQQKKAAMEQQQQQEKSQPKKMKTRGAIPEAAPAPPAGRGRFGAGVVRDKETKDGE